MKGNPENARFLMWMEGPWMSFYLCSCLITTVVPIVEKVAIASDKYDLPNLVRICDEYFFKHISLQNAAHLLILADRYGLHLLEKLALDFISQIINQFANCGGVQMIQQIDPM